VTSAEARGSSYRQWQVLLLTVPLVVGTIAGAVWVVAQWYIDFNPLDFGIRLIWMTGVQLSVLPLGTASLAGPTASRLRGLDVSRSGTALGRIAASMVAATSVGIFIWHISRFGDRHEAALGGLLLTPFAIAALIAVTAERLKQPVNPTR
jgi:hypothetical protein